MQELRQTVHGQLSGCISVHWGVGYHGNRGHRVEQLCLLDREGVIRASETDGDMVSNTEIPVPPLPGEDPVLVIAPYMPTAGEETTCMALGTLKGSVILLELPPGRPRSAYTLESWSVSAKALHSHAAPLDAVAWSFNGRFLATAAANGSVITW